MNFQLQHSSPLQSHNLSAEEQEEEGLLTDPTEKRFVPHLSALLQQEYTSYDPPPAQEQARRLLSPISTKVQAPAEPCNCSRARSLTIMNVQHPAVPQQQGCTDGPGHRPRGPSGNIISTKPWESICWSLEPLLSTPARRRRMVISL